MNIIGHPYIAFRVFGRLSEDLVLGSYLPDIVPFVPGSAFTFEEIHEGGEQLLSFLDDACPERRDLALGMLCHSVKFGADKFSGDMEEQFVAERTDYAKRIAEASAISLEMAREARFHNFLWWGVDVQLLRHRRKFVGELAKIVSRVDTAGAADLLAKCFAKDKLSVLRDIHFFLKPLSPERFLSVRGLVEIWRDIASGLPEKDQVDVEKTVLLFEDCAALVEDSWEGTLAQITSEIISSLRTLGVL